MWRPGARGMNRAVVPDWLRTSAHLHQVAQADVGLLHGDHGLVQVFLAAAVQGLHGPVGLLLLLVGRGDERLEDVAEGRARLAGRRGGRRGRGSGGGKGQ